MTVVSNIGRHPPPPPSPGMCWMLSTNPWKKEITRTWQDHVNSYLTCHRQDKATDIENYYEKYAATPPHQILHANVKVCHWWDQGMLEWIISLESDMIMLIRTFHRAHVVWSIQGNQYIYIYIYIIMSPISFVSPSSAIVPGEAYCHHEHES